MKGRLNNDLGDDGGTELKRFGPESSARWYVAPILWSEGSWSEVTAALSEVVGLLLLRPSEKRAVQECGDLRPVTD